MPEVPKIAGESQPSAVSAVVEHTGRPATERPKAEGTGADRTAIKEPACLGSVAAALLSLPLTFVGLVVFASQVDWGGDPVDSTLVPFLVVVGGFIFFVAPLLLASSMWRPLVTTLGATVFLVAAIALSSGTGDPPRESAAPTPPAGDEKRSDPQSRAQRSKRGERRRQRARAKRRREGSGTGSSSGDSDLIRKYCSEQNPGFFAQDQEQACESGLAE